jgi:4-amino-4-deoxy-L-arabinose transferase-like glycosyltransferase
VRRIDPALVGGLALAAVVLALLAPFASADPPERLTDSNAPWTDEGFNLANARQRVLFGEFATGDIDRSLTNGAYSGIAALVFAAIEPHLAVGRALSMVAAALAVLLLAVGLAEPLGPAAALLAAAALAGTDLMLEYGRLALVEPTLAALLSGALVLAVRAWTRPSPWAGAGLGLLLAAAMSVKAIALVPVLAMLGVPGGAALLRRDRRALAMSLVALVTALAAAAVWLLVVALPNQQRLRTGLRIWPEVHYLAWPWTLAGRFGRYLAQGSDGAVVRSLPLLLGAALGLVALGWRWRSLGQAARGALLLAALWGVGLWAGLAVGDYLPGHGAAPNRYVVPALPALAVLAGFGLASLAGLVRRRWAAAVAAAALAVALAAPGMARYLSGAVSSGDQRERDQRVLAAALPARASVYGAYAPTLLFDTRAELVSLWPPADANVDDPIGRFGITHVLAAGPQDVNDPTMRVPALRDLRGMTVVAQVPWAGEVLRLYRVPASRPGGGGGLGTTRGHGGSG